MLNCIFITRDPIILLCDPNGAATHSLRSPVLDNVNDKKADVRRVFNKLHINENGVKKIYIRGISQLALFISEL